MSDVVKVAYNLPGVIKLLWLVDQLGSVEKRFKVSPLLRFVERALDQARSTMETSACSPCSRGTFDKYRKRAGTLNNGETDDFEPFAPVMEAISIQSFKAIISFCNSRKPNSVEEISADN